MILHTLKDYKCDPKIKHISNEINECIEHFYKSLQIKAFDKIGTLIDSYKTTLDELQKEFLGIINEKESIKVDSIYVRTFDGACIDDYIQKRFNFTITKKQYKINYTYEKFYDVFLYEIGLLFAKHKDVYDFMIRYAQLKLLLNRFQFYSKDLYNNTYCINFTKNEMDNMYNTAMYLEFNQLPLLEKTQKRLLDNLIKGQDKIPGRKSKPTCPEDLEDLFEDWMNQKEKVLVIAEYYNCCERSARNYMLKYGCYEARATKKDILNIRKDIELSTDEIIENVEYDIKEAKDEIISISKNYLEAILNEIKELRSEIKELRKENEELKNEIRSLKEERNKENIFIGINNLGDIQI